MVINKWINYVISNDKILCNNVIKEYLSIFWCNIMNKLEEDQFILIQFKILNINNEVKSISYIQRVNKNEFESLSNIFIEFWDIKSEEYHLIDVIEVIFSYKIIDNKHDIKQAKYSKHKNINSNIKKNNFTFYGYNLPNTMDYSKWGNYHKYTDSNGIDKIIVYKPLSESEYHLTLHTNYNEIEIKNNNKVIFKFKDILLMDNSKLNSFRREIKDQIIWYENGIITLKSIKRKCKFITSIKQSISLSNKFLTMDIETRNINGELIPYCISLFDGINVSNFYLSEYSNSNELLESAILSIMKRKYSGYKVYLHNFSNFDGVFLLKILCKLSSNINPIINDNNLINITFKFSKYYLHFRDSFLLLPSSLSKLAKEFNVENKEVFPVLFVNKGIDLNYKGEVPSFDYFVNLDKSEYLEYKKRFKNNIWDLKSESIKYCNQDVITLHQIIKKFSLIIFNEIRLDILNYPTLSSLSFAIYRSKFLGEFKIPIILGNLYKDIKDSYTGGNVDVYRPYGKNIYHYDVNSLYPYVMKNFKLPTGNPIYFEGDILKYTTKPYGFFKVEIITPENLNVPLLQKRMKINNSIKTIAPLGQWEGFYFSEEIYKAKELGYKIKIKSGYIFEQDFIFKEFVDYFYKLKVNSNRNSPNYIISKLILNGLYGRLGMNPVKENHIIVDSSKSIEIYNKFNVTDVICLDNKELISYFNNENNKIDDYDIGPNVSVPISAAVTALSRIYMHDFKNKFDGNIYYTDTDSIDIDKELDNIYIGNELGKFKLEYVAKKSIFLAPKVYYTITDKDIHICKIKGVNLIKSNVITDTDFEDLLIKDQKIVLNQDKWYKNFSNGSILIKKELYTLTQNSGKRILIYDKHNKIIDSKPLIIKNDIVLT